MLKIRRAIISVWNKKGIIEFAKVLAEFNVEIISTGKTALLLRKNKIPVKDVATLTAFPEILSGRVKTLHPKVFGGVLANKKHPLHMEEIKDLGIEPFDLVVVNLYPFPEKVSESLSWDEMIEYIDIGGPALLRAAAKNYKNVVCVSNPLQYKAIAQIITQNKGFVPFELLKGLAQEVFLITKEYDNSVYNYFCGKKILSWNLEETQKLRYGENPHQKAALFSLINKKSSSFRQIQGKELSFNNFLDLDTAIQCAKEFVESAAVIVKHASICGVGIDKKLSLAYKKAYQTDAVSSFGGIIGLNKKVDKETAKQILKSEFKECVIAPAFSKEGLKLFATKPNLRVVEIDFFANKEYRDVRRTTFGYLLQDVDKLVLPPAQIKVVTKRKPTDRELKDLFFAWKVVKFVRSNAIVIAKNKTALGVCGGQPSRVGAMKIALANVVGSSRGGVVASDGFFPKDDSIVAAHKKGIKAIIQPGGSIRDQEVIKACDKLGIAMVFTEIRHFRH